MTRIRFHDRIDAGRRLGRLLAERDLCDPVVLGIPRGGVEVGAALADVIDAELDVVLAHKLRAPFQPELAVGAVAEDGSRWLDPVFSAFVSEAQLEREIRHQQEEMQRRSELLRRTRPPAAVEGRSVIVTDDGLATGSTMRVAIESVRPRSPMEIILAVPVGAPDRLEEIGELCDDVCCPLAPPGFRAIGQFYERFDQVADERVIELLEANSMGRR
jgi:putative phosphoribosyl transferase